MSEVVAVVGVQCPSCGMGMEVDSRGGYVCAVCLWSRDDFRDWLFGYYPSTYMAWRHRLREYHLEDTADSCWLVVSLLAPHICDEFLGLPDLEDKVYAGIS